MKLVWPETVSIMKFHDFAIYFNPVGQCLAGREICRTKSHKILKYFSKGNSEENDVKALKEIVETLGGWPLQEGSAWDGTSWSMQGTIETIRKSLGHRTDKIFDVASFIINLENANNVSLFSLDIFTLLQQ